MLCAQPNMAEIVDRARLAVTEPLFAAAAANKSATSASEIVAAVRLCNGFASINKYRLTSTSVRGRSLLDRAAMYWSATSLNVSLRTRLSNFSAAGSWPSATLAASGPINSRACAALSFGCLRGSCGAPGRHASTDKPTRANRRGEFLESVREHQAG